MKNLATYSNYAKANRQILNSLNCIELLRTAQMSSKVSYRARENISLLLDMLNAEVVPGSSLGWYLLIILLFIKINISVNRLLLSFNL